MGDARRQPSRSPRGQLAELKRGEERRAKAMRLACAFAVAQAEQWIAYEHAPPHLYHGFSSRVQGYCFGLADTGWEHCGFAGDALDVAVFLVGLSRFAGFDSPRESSNAGGAS